MFFKNPFRKPYFTKEFYIVLIIAVLVLLFCAILLRPAHAIKTQEIEIKEDGGSYDGKVKIYRIANDILVIYTDASTLQIEDGNITTTGKITTGQSSVLANLLFLNYAIRSPDGAFYLQAAENLFLQLDYDNDGVHSLFILDGTGATVFTFQEAGHAFITGGLNLGTSTGASTGDIKMNGGNLDLYDSTDTGYWKNSTSPGYTVHDYYSWFGTRYQGHEWLTYKGSVTPASSQLVNKGSYTAEKGINVGTALGAGTGVIKASDDIWGQTLRLNASTTSLPSASATYSGQFRILRDPLDTAPDTLYICLRSAEAAGFTWVLVAAGFEP